ncbi:MAG: RluA family pseudouridine synthase [Clostridia bacterium]|nr:RluA family pseudouridine synthase [Clostridia bacterium]
MDESILVVDKNAGVEVETGLAAELGSLYGEVRPLHRLDANTEGLVAFARTPEAEARLLRAFEERRVEKVYHAVVRGRLTEPGKLRDYVLKDAERALVRVVPPGTPGALACELSYVPLETDGERSLLEIRLITGRTHQIRVQMAAFEHPVLGDDKYGDRDFNRRFRARGQRLLAKRLTIEGRGFTSLRELKL